MKKRILPFILLISYLIILIQVLVFKHLALIRIGELRFNFGGTQEGAGNFIPFKTILYYLLGNNGLLIGSINIIGNIIALVPLGFLLPFVFPKMTWKKTIALAIITGFIIEGTQVLLHVGIFDIDDVILNGLGVLIGFWKYNLFATFSKNTKAITSAIVFGILATLIVLYMLSYYKLIRLPIGIEPAIEREHLPPMSNQKMATQTCCDLCGGTGGTGKIIALGNNTITIQRKDGVVENIKLTNQTIIKNAAGTATSSILRIGDHITVVIDDTETASLVLVCKS